MSRFRLADGDLTISGSDGRTRFNSDDGLFHTVDKFSGSATFASFQVSDGHGTKRTEDKIIGACHADCTDIIGSVKCTGGAVTWSGGGPPVSTTGIPSGIWQSVMGGSALVLYQDGHGPNSAANPNLGLYQMAILFFVIESSVVKLRRQSWVSSGSQGNMNINAQTVSYKLKVGLFT